MKIGERLLLIFMTIVFFALIVLIGGCIWNEAVYGAVTEAIRSTVYIKIAVSAVLLIFFVLSVRAMLAGTGKNADETTMAASTEAGGIYINLDTISELASKAVKKVEGVREIRVKTFIREEGASIAVKVSLFPEIVMPEACKQIQQSVKNDVETLCGIAVKNISVQVDNSLQSQK